MIFGKRGDAHVAVVVHDALIDDVRVDRRAGAGMLLDEIAPDVNVVVKEIEHGARQALGVARAVQLERPRLPPELPRRDEEIGQPRGVIGVQVRQEDRAHVVVLQIGGGDAHRRAAAGVDEEPLIARDHHRRRAGVRRIGTRKAGADEDHLDRGGENHAKQ